MNLAGSESWREQVRSRPLVAVLGVTGLIGFIVGLLFARWQYAVEPGQALAGLVQLPRDNPWYFLSVKTWSLNHQVAAGLLKLGLSERGVSLLFSGLAGLLSFQAIGVIAFALGRNAIGAIGVCLLAVYILGTQVPGVTYPQSLFGSSHTNGMIGLSLILLALALLGAGSFRLGGFLLGLAPALHGSLAIWAVLCIGVAAIPDLRYITNSLWRVRGFVAAGAALSVISLMAFLWLARGAEVAPSSAVLADYVAEFLRHWDVLWRPFSWLRDPVVLIFVGWVTGCVALLLRGDPLSREARWLLRILLVSVLFGLAGSAFYWLPPEDMPRLIVMFMPSRLLNLMSIAAVPLALGLWVRYWQNVFVRTFLAFVIALQIAQPLPLAAFAAISGALLFALLRLDPSKTRPAVVMPGALLILFGLWLPTNELSPISAARLIHQAVSLRGFVGLACVLVGGAFLLTSMRRRAGGRDSDPHPSILDRLKVPTGKAALIAFVLASLGLTAQYAFTGWSNGDNILRRDDRSTVLREAARGSGLLLTCSDLAQIQLRTRRPVLLPGYPLDGLVYTPAIGPEMNRILMVVHGIDVLNPPKEIRRRHPAGLLPSSGREVFEKRSTAEWQELGSQFGLVEVLCHADWNLALPQVARDVELALYRIP